MLSDIGFNVIPSIWNIFNAICITMGLWFLIKLTRMIYYEITMYKGAGEDYLEKGLAYVKSQKRLHEELLQNSSRKERKA